jgi:hypothetical protein
MSTQVKVSVIPKCDFCSKPARFDFKTKMGPWANGCDEHYLQHRAFADLGTGKGQELKKEEK